MRSLQELKKNKETSLERLTQKIADLNNSANPSQADDDRFWYPAGDKSGSGSAVIRFLPEISVSASPFVRLFHHAFQGPTGQWLIEQCPTTIGQKCPICEHNNKLWNSGVEANKKYVSENTKRKVTYISNIYVINDPLNPENNGQVKLFKYGKKLFDKINGAMNPEFSDIEPVNIFDLWEGATFRIRFKKDEKSKFRTYDASSFDSVSPLSDNDEVLEEIFNKQYDLDEFLSPKAFKSYDELMNRRDFVLGLGGDIEREAGVRQSSPVAHDEDDNDIPESSVTGEVSDEAFLKQFENLDLD